MKIMLVAVNAKYIHANLAVYSLKAYAGDYAQHIEIAEYTINQYADDILADIIKQRPDVVAFSCYIWNMRMIEEVAGMLGKLRSDMPVWLGGPEVSYNARERLVNDRDNMYTGIMVGEGEETFRELAASYLAVVRDDSEHETENSTTKNSMTKRTALDAAVDLSGIPGIIYKKDDTVVDNGWRALTNMDKIPFVYQDMTDFENKIVYYETSRGCPFSCSYCLSSIDKKVRFRSMALVERELQFFIDQKVPQVKFVDRTFNCSKAHAMAIWQFIKAHDQGVTNFHFEIGADLLGDEEIELLGSLRPGLVQLEIGVQSTYMPTIQEVSRTMQLEKLRRNVARVNAGHNIHQHLDLIAGLPFEDYERFKQSFNDVYAMAPEQLQLGFLKVLNGSAMRDKAEDYGIIYRSKPTYEVLSTPWMSYEELCRLKGVEEMTEVYYNSRQFTASIAFLCGQFGSPFEFYEALADYYEQHGLFKAKHTRMRRYEILRDFVRDETNVPIQGMEQLMLYDLYLRENLKSRPEWAPEQKADKKIYETIETFYRNEEKSAHYLPAYTKYTSRQMRRMTHLEIFRVDIQAAAESGRLIEKTYAVLFDYQVRDPLSYEARTVQITEI